MNLSEEFDRQLNILLQKDYPLLANLDPEQFKKLIIRLKKYLPKQLPDIDIVEGKLPFVIVIQSQLIPAETMMSKVVWKGKPGLVKLFPHQPLDFQIRPDLKIPQTQAYLLYSINRGKDFLNISPEDASTKIIQRKQTPLTIDEGIAIITHFPEFLIKNNCFSLLGSRIPGNKIVPAIWINSLKQPNLGWCWNGNPHTWLGSAYAEARQG